ncbi:carbohydrate kinase [Microtetraspora sp. NBRC 16547]|uniref:carbohydrate kinase family protein n=1 Tax=Microtetraspora sp. NBRC 16547 TaxID=3030993 RepID=UPI0024A2CE83|nr:carbohydrate kinase [Microtetraspora sp. NBRC 16547]GLW96495.1 putative fructokinase [Microtetraspora sp. NBRC 16547]
MIIVCGEALIDLVPAGAENTWRAVPGGGPANTAVAVARLGTPARLLCRLSRDGFGWRLRDHLTANGVDLGLAVETAEPTTLAVVDLDEHGSADFRFYMERTADWQWTPGELPASLPPGTRALHVGSLAAVVRPGAAVLRSWAAGHRDAVTVVYDVNVRPAVLPGREPYLEQVEAWLRVAHVVKASEEDLRWLHPERDPLDTARAWLADHGLDLVLVTRGAAGAVALGGDGPPVEADGVAVRVVDTVGAGDAFTGAFLHASMDRAMPLAESLRYAVRAAALTCTREGAAPPARAEVDAGI